MLIRASASSKVLLASTLFLCLAFQDSAAHAADPPPRPKPPETNTNKTVSVTPEQIAAVSDKEILASINKGVDYLLVSVGAEIQTFKAPPHPGQMDTPGYPSQKDVLAGDIALSVYALLTIGRVTGDPRCQFSSKEMQESVKFLLDLRTTFTYAVALQASALSLLPNRPELRKPLAIDRDELVRGIINGGYIYLTAGTNYYSIGPHPDNSNSQYGQLGAWACQDAGLEIPNGYWEAVDHHWRTTQNADGGWGYFPASFKVSGSLTKSLNSYAGMTAAGVASLYLAQDQLDHAVTANPKVDKSLEAALKWLNTDYENFRSTLAADLYLAYGIERVALSAGIKNFGTHDWYREGAALLVANQSTRGEWRHATFSMPGAESSTCDPSTATAYALLFLARGIAPVAVGKLQYDGPWDARARDCSRFTHWLSKQTEKTLNWQNISLATDPAEWQNVPVLVITGHDDPKFTPQQIAKLKRYVQNGGLIFSSADDGNPAFTKAIQKKYAPALCDNAYEMRALPEDHPAFNLNYKVPKYKQPHLFGLSNGVREIWIHSADDIAASWQSYATATTQNFEVPANIYFYTQGHSPLAIHYAPLVPPPPPASTTTIDIARIVYSGNWDPEPAAWIHFIENARQKHAATIHILPTTIADLDPAKTPIAHITGTGAFTLSQADRTKLAEFLAKGGTLLADSTAGSDAFSTSFKANIALLFPNSHLADVAPDNPVLTGVLPAGEPIQKLTPRPFCDTPANRTRPLTLMELRQNNKPIILFSPGDLTAGIGNLHHWGILGYSPESADPLTWNALVYLTAKATPDPPHR